jgi:Pentapeptide repeats (8 copies)
MRRRTLRWTGWALLIAGILGVAGLLFFQGPWWTDGKRLRALPAKDQHEALSKDRDALLKILAGTGAAVALTYTARKHTLDRAAHTLSEQGQVTDRYTKAIEQLGSENLDVRLGGLYALERIARDSPVDHPTVVEVLAAFIREHSTRGDQGGTLDADSGGSARVVRMRHQLHRHQRPDQNAPPGPPATDVQAALTVLARRNPAHDRDPINLSRAQLQGAYLPGAQLRDADLSNAQLRGADLSYARLQGAYLVDAQLQDVVLLEAQLQDAVLLDAQLQDARLPHAQLQGANLIGAQLQGANLIGAQLQGTDLREAEGLTAEQLAQAASQPDPDRLPHYLRPQAHPEAGGIAGDAPQADPDAGEAAEPEAAPTP